MKILLTVPETCEYLGVSRTTLYALLRRGELRAVKIGNGTRVPVENADQYAANLKQYEPMTAA